MSPEATEGKRAQVGLICDRNRPEPVAFAFAYSLKRHPRFPFLSATRSRTERRSAEIACLAASSKALELDNGSRIVCLPGMKDHTIRGFSNAALLVVDEAAWVSDLLYSALRPMLAVSGGRIVLLSTPWGRRGFFFEEYTTAGREWERVTITAHDCPRIDPDWLERERQQIPDWVFRQVYLCEFVETEDAAFSYDSVLVAVSDEVAPFFPVELRA